MTRSEIIEALRKADGPMLAREANDLAFAIVTAFNLQSELVQMITDALRKWTRFDPLYPVDCSLSNAIALVERVRPDLTGIIPLDANQEAWLWPRGGNPKGWRVTAATPAIALVLALLESMEDN